ncbi:hypothetical protein U1Q18_021530 [Sarracenia purpurea var. burkii]
MVKIGKSRAPSFPILPLEERFSILERKRRTAVCPIGQDGAGVFAQGRSAFATGGASNVFGEVGRDQVEEFFDVVYEWSYRESSSHRKAWVSIMGVPLHTWCESTFSMLGDLWGSTICVDARTSKKEDLEVGYALIYTEHIDTIHQNCDLKWVVVYIYPRCFLVVDLQPYVFAWFVGGLVWCATARISVHLAAIWSFRDASEFRMPKSFCNMDSVHP